MRPLPEVLAASAFRGVDLLPTSRERHIVTMMHYTSNVQDQEAHAITALQRSEVDAILRKAVIG